MIIPKHIWLIEEKIGDRVRLRSQWFYTRKEAREALNFLGFRFRFMDKMRVVKYKLEAS